MMRPLTGRKTPATGPTRNMHTIVPMPTVPPNRKPDSAKTAQLRLLASSGYYIATYTDETGQQRVAGSKDWPLSLSVEYSGGLLQCTLQGKGTEVDPYTL